MTKNFCKETFDVFNRYKNNIMFCIKFRENICVKYNFE